MRPRHESSPRRLTDEQRTTLRRRIAAVPPRATLDDPAVTDLLDYYQSLEIPWWAHGFDYRMRLGNVAAGLASMRRILDLDDWGAEPTRTATDRIMKDD